MIQEVEGDILLTEAGAVAHGVALHDNFANGLALALRERWPAMYKDFKHACQVSEPKPGELWTWGGAGGVRIINLLTQAPPPNHGGRPGKASVENVNHCSQGFAENHRGGKVYQCGAAQVSYRRRRTGLARCQTAD